MNTFPVLVSPYSERKREKKKAKKGKGKNGRMKKKEPPAKSKIDNRGKTKRKKNSANIPSRNLIVHDLPYVGGDLPVSIHLGHYTHLNVNLLSHTHTHTLSPNGSNWQVQG